MDSVPIILVKTERCVASNTWTARTPSHWSESGPQPTISVDDKRICFVSGCSEDQPLEAHCMKQCRPLSTGHLPVGESLSGPYWKKGGSSEEPRSAHVTVACHALSRTCQGWSLIIGICGQTAEANGDLTNSGVIKSTSRWLHRALSPGCVTNLHCQLGQTLCSFWASFSPSLK